MWKAGFALVGICATFTALAGGCSGKYRRPTTPEKVDLSPERIARGGYIVNQAASCGACHTPREGDSILSGERADAFLAGQWELRRGRRYESGPSLPPPA